jgi:hypothetical protein
MQKQTLELANPDKTLIYKGEAGVVDDRFTLNGLGSLECRGFVDN